MTIVIERWKTVLALICASNGDNGHIDTCRGSLFVPLALPAFDSSSDEDGGIENGTDESDNNHDDNEATIAGLA